MSERSKLISRLSSNRESRRAYIKAKLSVLVPAQIRALRLKFGMPTQTHLAKAAGMHQSRISMFETPGANITLDTLARIAAALHVGLVVKFVPFSEMLRWDNGFSHDQFSVTRIEKDRAFLGEAEPPKYQSLPISLLLAESISAHTSGNQNPIQAHGFDMRTLLTQIQKFPKGGPTIYDQQAAR